MWIKKQEKRKKRMNLIELNRIEKDEYDHWSKIQI